MRILKLEYKRLLKTRSNWVFLGLALLLSVWMAVIPTTFPFVNYLDDGGNLQKLTGMDAYRYSVAAGAELAGEITPEKLKTALEAYQSCLEQYGAEAAWELPDGVYGRELYSYAAMYPRLREAYADSQSGMTQDLKNLDSRQLDDFYAQCNRHIRDLMALEYPDFPAAQEKAIALYERTEQPYVYYPSFSSDVMDYQTMTMFLILLLCTLVAAPVFSSDYQTGADDILRCTKHGRWKLGAAKITAALSLSAGTFTVCTALFLVITNSIFGWETAKTSVRLIYSIVSLVKAPDMLSLQIGGALMSLVFLLASVSFTLFLSSKLASTMGSTAAAVTAAFLPLLGFMFVRSNAMTWLCAMLPGSGLGMQNGVLQTLVDFQFLRLGNQAFWLPHVQLFFSAVEIPLMIALTLHSYCRHIGK